MHLRRNATCALLFAAVIAVAGCGSQGTNTATGDASSSNTPAAASPAAASPAAAGTVTMTDPWVKTMKSGMTAMFGTIVNNTDAAVTVVSASTPVSPRVELHEVVDDGGKSVMRPKEGGFAVPAKGTHLLEPGADHIMVMDVKDPIKPGDEVAFTLTLSNGNKVEIKAVGKDFAGGNESYDPGKSGDHSDHSGHGESGNSGGHG
ncbi:hypothetical protein SAMN05421505_102112 [Sinosporangium album]|uniref:Copper(I)-binding protein n=1 Tax=Sinosporangium album TaxID=504805 RepID=A0A1G7RZY6_9ACTN|nr:copper chaperone PCu(A)C [Sinosporangium album]SDG16254.1 hypothetical protein SAMN05421505_102112 [Sinosporangium album]